MSSNAVLITGGNSGIGFECARELARNGWQVVIASRDRALSATAVERIKAETGNAAVSELGVDLGSAESVRELAREIAARDLPLRALVCNAGLQVSGARRTSADGFELTFAVNHLGHFLLTNLLLERLRANAPARIVIVSSGVHDPQRFDGHAEGGDHRHGNARRGRCGRVRALQRPTRVREQQALQPLVRLRARSPDCGVGSVERRRN